MTHVSEIHDQYEQIEAIEELKRLHTIYAHSRRDYLAERAGTTEEKNAMARMDYAANQVAQYVKHLLEEGFIK